MTTNAQQDIDALERYFDWREQIHHTGIDDTTAGYREHLRNEEAKDVLTEIAKYARKLQGWTASGEADGSDLEGFHRTVLELIPDQYKEVTT